jgi:hypothetical protein
VDAATWTLAGECAMTLLLPGLLYLLLMRIPGCARAVRRVRQWQREHDVSDYCDSLGTEGGEDIARR